MATTAALDDRLLVARPSLSEAIEELHFKFATMKDELRDAHDEIARLRNTMTSCRSGLQAMPKADLKALRRRVAFFCHPDRGGDAGLMGRLNTIFDFLESSQELCLPDGGIA